MAIHNIKKEDFKEIIDSLFTGRDNELVTRYMDKNPSDIVYAKALQLDGYPLDSVDAYEFLFLIEEDTSYFYTFHFGWSDYFDIDDGLFDDVEDYLDGMTEEQQEDFKEFWESLEDEYGSMDSEVDEYFIKNFDMSYLTWLSKNDKLDEINYYGNKYHFCGILEPYNVKEESLVNFKAELDKELGME